MELLGGFGDRFVGERMDDSGGGGEARGGGVAVRHALTLSIAVWYHGEGCRGN